MRAFLRSVALVFLIFLARVEVRAQSAASSGPPPAGQSSSSTPAAGQHARKVWTNENIGTVAGRGATVGSGSSLSDRHNLRSYSSDGVSIVRPSAGTVVSPGEALQIEVFLDPARISPRWSS
jgi:hypothetical protein